MIRSAFLLLAALVALVGLLLQLAGILLVGLVRLLVGLVRAFSRATTSSSVRVSPGSVLR